MDGSYILVGNSNITGYAVDTISSSGDLVYSILDDQAKDTRDEYMDIPIIESSQREKYLELIGEKCSYFVTLQDNGARFETSQSIYQDYGVKQSNIIHENTSISPFADIGIGNLIMEGVYIGPHAKIGDGNIILPNTTIESSCEIKNYVYVGPGCSLGYKSTLHDRTYLSSKVCISPNIVIEENVTLAPGTVVMQSVSSNLSMYGNPAKAIE